MSFANVLSPANHLASNFNFGIPTEYNTWSFMSNDLNNNNNAQHGFGFGTTSTLNPWATTNASAVRSTKRAREDSEHFGLEDSTTKRRVLEPAFDHTNVSSSIPFNSNFGLSYVAPSSLPAASPRDGSVSPQNIVPIPRDEYLPRLEPETIELEEVQPGAIILHPKFANPINRTVSRGHKSRRSEATGVEGETIDYDTCKRTRSTAMAGVGFDALPQNYFLDVDYRTDEHPLRSIAADNRLRVKPTWTEDVSKAIIIYTPPSLSSFTPDNCNDDESIEDVVSMDTL
jgi:hypothetical protein